MLIRRVTGAIGRLEDYSLLGQERLLEARARALSHDRAIQLVLGEPERDQIRGRQYHGPVQPTSHM